VNARTITNFSLLCLVILLVAYLSKTGPAPSPSGMSVVSTMDPALVHHILISRPGKPDVEMARRDRGWMLTRPVLIAANSFRVSSILELPPTPSRSQLNVSEPDLPRYGLAPAQAILALNGSRFLFGDVNPADRGRFLLHGQTVHVVNDTLYQQLLQDAGFFVNPRVLPDGGNLVRIRTPGIELVYRNGAWEQVDGGNKLPGDRLAAIAAAWSDLETARTSIPVTSGPGVADILLDTSSGDRIGLSITRSSVTELVLSRTDPHIEYRFSPGLSQQLGISLDGAD
jgi:hypothetical protein